MAIVYAAAVFLAGAVAGTLVVKPCEHARSHVRQLAPAERTQAQRDYYVRQFRSELELDDNQCRQLASILNDTLGQYADVQSFLRSIRWEGTTRIRGILDEHQRQRFDQLLKAESTGRK